MIYLFRFFIFIIFVLLLHACTPRLTSHFLQSEDIQYQASTLNRNQVYNRCNDPLAYAPDTAHLDHTPMKYVRVNVHWMNAVDSASNFNGQEAIDFTHQLLAAINKDLANNQRNWLPYNNTTPTLPTQYRFVLTPRANDFKDIGIYFHYDNDLSPYVHKGKNANLHKREPIKQYSIDGDHILNIFIMPHHPDSVKSATYGAYGVGVSLGDAVKAAGMFENRANNQPENYRGLFNHEIGHIFGLGHAWLYDGCDDTPEHANKCWAWTPESPCDTLASNNVMDYNAYQHAWTPCQIGKIHQAMAQEGTVARRFLQPNWCQLHEDQHIIIRDSIHWRGAKDLEGHLTIATGAYLKVDCRVSLPAGAKITVQPGGTLVLDNAILHNACGDRWEGIEIQSLGKNKGQVIFIGEPKLENMRSAIIPITP
ncbi:MAG: M43 family zinc metalloprotease [Saprospiraceae bacterium]